MKMKSTIKIEKVDLLPKIGQKEMYNSACYDSLKLRLASKIPSYRICEEILNHLRWQDVGNKINILICTYCFIETLSGLFVTRGCHLPIRKLFPFQPKRSKRTNTLWRSLLTLKLDLKMGVYQYSNGSEKHTKG